MDPWLRFWMTFAAAPVALAVMFSAGSWFASRIRGTSRIGAAAISLVAALAGLLLGLVVTPYVFREL
jgi:hypothetical protein